MINYKFNNNNHYKIYLNLKIINRKYVSKIINHYLNKIKYK